YGDVAPGSGSCAIAGAVEVRRDQRGHAMNCREVQSLVHASLDGELDLIRQMEIDDHLRQCQACEAFFASQRALQAAVKTDGLYVTAPAGLEPRIRAGGAPCAS